MNTHLKGIGVDNFRVFKGSHYFDFAPITILTGTNSSGKSSLINLLKLLNETYKDFKGDYFGMNTREKLSLNEFLMVSLNKNFCIKKFGNIKNLLNNQNISKDTIEISSMVSLPNYEDSVKIKIDYTYKLTNKGVENANLVGIKMSIVEVSDMVFKEFENNIFFKELLKNNNLVGKEIFSLDVAKDNSTRTKINLEVLYMFELSNTVRLNGVSNFLMILDTLCNTEQKKKDVEFILNKEYNQKVKINNHLIFNIGLFRLLSNIKWTAKYFPDDMPDFGIDTSYIYLKNSSWGRFSIKDSYGFSLKDFLLRAFCNGSDEIFNEEWWIANNENPFFYTSNLKQQGFIKNVFLPILKVIFSDADLGNAFFDSMPQLPEEIIQPRFEDFWQTTFFDYVFYSHFVYELLNKITTNTKIFKSIDSIGNERTNRTRVVSILETDETSRRVIDNRLSENKLNIITTFWRKHLQIFEIAKDIKIEIDDESMYYKIFLKGNNDWMNLKDFGFGVSQLMPILFSISQNINTRSEEERALFLFSEAERYYPLIMLVEEPESNLHPALQSKLADFFVEASELFNIQFIIETHSEYFIRKMQFLTAKKTIKPSDTQIYYFHHPDRIPEGEEQVYPINIKEDGRLTRNFGEGFFDETSRLMIEILNLNLN